MNWQRPAYFVAGYALVLFINIVKALFTAKTQTKIFKNITTIDYLFYRLAASIDFSWARKRLIKKAIKLLAITIIFNLLQFRLAANSTSQPIYNLLLLTFIRIRCIHFFFFIDVIQAKLVALNDQIKRLNDQNACARRVPLTADLLASCKTSQQMFSRLYVMKHIHRKLWKITNIVNDCCGLSILVITAIYFVSLTFDAYFCYFSFVDRKYNRAYGEKKKTVLGRVRDYIGFIRHNLVFVFLFPSIDSLCSAIPDIFTLLTVVGSCNACYDMVCRVTLHRLLRLMTPFFAGRKRQCQCPRHREQLWKWALQWTGKTIKAHRKPRDKP